MVVDLAAREKKNSHGCFMINDGRLMLEYKLGFAVDFVN